MLMTLISRFRFVSNSNLQQYKRVYSGAYGPQEDLCYDSKRPVKAAELTLPARTFSRVIAGSHVMTVSVGTRTMCQRTNATERIAHKDSAYIRLPVVSCSMLRDKPTYAVFKGSTPRVFS